MLYLSQILIKRAHPEPFIEFYDDFIFLEQRDIDDPHDGVVEGDRILLLGEDMRIYRVVHIL